MNSAKPILLAIDDDAVVLTSVLSTLKDEFSVRPFTSGESALNFLSGASADLILLDYQMPGLTGFDVLDALQAEERFRTIPVIFLTGSMDGESEAEALERGAIDYIRKPFKPRALLTRVRLQVELQRHRKDLEALVLEKTKDLKEAYTKLKLREEITLNILARVTDLRDHDTGNHIARTTAYVRILVTDLLENPHPDYALSMQEGEDIVRSAKLHDLGKIAVPDHILLKPGKLTVEEFAIIMRHSEHGASLLSDFTQEMEDSFLTTARAIACSHHERWNGEGYPQGLAGRDIPLAARIVAIADVYDALSSPRPYKKAFSADDSFDIIRENSGTQFDPYLVAVFLRHSEEVKEISASLCEEKGEVKAAPRASENLLTV